MEIPRGIKVDTITTGNIIRGVAAQRAEFAGYATFIAPYIGIMKSGGLLPDPHIAVAYEMRLRQNVSTHMEKGLPQSIMAVNLLGVNGAGKGEQSTKLHERLHDQNEHHKLTTVIQVGDGGLRTEQQYKDTRDLYQRLNEYGFEEGIMIPLQDICVYYDLPVEEAQNRSFGRLRDSIREMFRQDGHSTSRPLSRSEVLKHYEEACERGIARVDDHPDTVKERIRLFNENSKPVLELAKSEGKLQTIDASGSVLAVHNRTLNVILPYLNVTQNR